MIRVTFVQIPCVPIAYISGPGGLLTFTCILVCCMGDNCTMFCLEGYPEAAAHPECSDTSSYEHPILYPHNTCGSECNSSSGLLGPLSPIKPYEDFIQTLECLPVLYNQTKLACFGFYPTSPPNETQQVDLLCHST